MRTSKNILTEKEMELVGMLMQDCQSTGDIQLKRQPDYQQICLFGVRNRHEWA